eukprot:COSAG02_NODE_34630_length_480_cov_0.722513_1_plen_100_part_10
MTQLDTRVDIFEDPSLESRLTSRRMRPALVSAAAAAAAATRAPRGQVLEGAADPDHSVGIEMPPKKKQRRDAVRHSRRLSTSTEPDSVQSEELSVEATVS